MSNNEKNENELIQELKDIYDDTIKYIKLHTDNVIKADLVAEAYNFQRLLECRDRFREICNRLNKIKT